MSLLLCWILSKNSRSNRDLSPSDFPDGDFFAPVDFTGYFRYNEEDKLPLE